MCVGVDVKKNSKNVFMGLLLLRQTKPKVAKRKSYFAFSKPSIFFAKCKIYEHLPANHLSIGSSEFSAKWSLTNMTNMTKLVNDEVYQIGQ